MTGEAYPLAEEVALRLRVAVDRVVFDVERDLPALADLNEVEERAAQLRALIEQRDATR